MKDTTPVGHYPAGVSPYGCFDMAGNVWEWTSSLWGKDWQTPEYRYPYDPTDGRESLSAPDAFRRVLRGGSFFSYRNFVRCAYRFRVNPDNRNGAYGFRLLSPGG